MLIKKLLNKIAMLLLMVVVIILLLGLFGGICGMIRKACVYTRLNLHYNDVSKAYYDNMPEKQDGDWYRVREQMAVSGDKLFWDIRIWTIQQGIKNQKLYDYAYNLHNVYEQKEEEKIVIEKKKANLKAKKNDDTFQDRLIHTKGEK